MAIPASRATFMNTPTDSVTSIARRADSPPMGSAKKCTSRSVNANEIAMPTTKPTSARSKWPRSAST